MRALDFYVIGLIVFTLGLLYLTWALMTNEIFRVIVGVLHIVLGVYIFNIGRRK